MSKVKGLVVRTFWEFVARYLPLSQAILVTLGGEGLEAALWKECGVPDDQGWLIERSRDKSQKLIRGFRYRYNSSLGGFINQFQSSHGELGVVDGFHLDLCGTFEAGDISEEFGAILPLIMHSRGRSFAVTVADERENRSARNPTGVQARLERLVGQMQFRHLYKARLREQSELNRVYNNEWNPEKGAYRELGFIVSLVERMLENQTFGLEVIKRFSYESDTYGPRGLRMRTYVFRFAKPARRSAKIDVQGLFRLWDQSPLTVVTSTGFTDVTVPEKRVKLEEVRMKEYHHLAQIVSFASQPVKDDYAALLAELERLRAAAELGLAMTSVGVGFLKSERTSEAVSIPGLKPLANPRRAAKAKASAKPVPVKKTKALAKSVLVKNTATLDQAAQTQLQIDLVLAKADGEKAFDAMRQKAIKRLGYGASEGNPVRRFGSFFARTQAGLRHLFMKRVMVDIKPDDQLIEQLASAYSTITGSSVTADQLRQEATSV